MTKISFIVVAYNAAQSLDALLGDLLAQTVDPRQLEALLVDSASTDDTAQITRRFAERAPFEVKLLENPKRWLACGINVALRAATGDAIIRLDAHARMPKDFLQKNLDALARGKDIVGGSVIGADPDNAWEAVTRALDTSRFCGGAAPFRNGGEARYVDTLAYALYRREVYDRVGFYDERLRRTEDNDMHYRMRKAGYRFIFRRISSRGTPRARRFAASSARNGATATGLGAQCGFSRAALPRAISYPRCSCWR